MSIIWQLNPNVTDYGIVALDNQFDAKYKILDGSPKLSSWKPLYISYRAGEEKPIPHFPSLSSSIVCDMEAKLLIQDLIDDYVEFLPLVSHTITEQQYHIINTTMILDCLDQEKSEVLRNESGTIRHIKKYVMKPNCIGDAPIFKLPEPMRERPYVSDTFKQIVEENNLTGLVFDKVWDD